MVPRAAAPLVAGREPASRLAMNSVSWAPWVEPTSGGNWSQAACSADWPSAGVNRQFACL